MSKISSKKKSQNKEIKQIQGRLISPQLRKCPSCKLYMVETRQNSLKTTVQCKNCSLKYTYPNYPAFIEIDYYTKMINAYSKDVKDGVITPPSVAFTGSVIGSCPICKIGSFAIIVDYNRKAIVKCENKECQIKFTLPKKGYFQGAGTKCTQCNWPLLKWEFKSKGASTLYCFNPACRFKDKWTYKK